MNPWETWGRFYYDARWESPDNETLNKCQKQDKAKSLLYLTKYSLTQTHTNFEVDNFLNLSTNHEYLLELNAEVRSPGNLFVGRKDKEEITSGFYLLRMAIVHNKEYAGDTGVVTILKKIVPISQGKVLLNFKTKALDLKSLFARNEIIFELEPINDQKINPNSKSTDSIELLNPSEGLDSAVDTNSGLITQAFMGQVLLKDKDNSQSLIPLNSSVIKAYLFNDFKEVKNSPSIILGLEKTFNQDLQKLQANLVQVSQFSELEKSQNLKLINIRKNDDTLKTFLEKSDQLPLKHLSNEFYYEKPSPYLASKLCAYFVRYLLKESISPYYFLPIYRSCYEMSVKDPQNMFITESFWKIGKVISAEMIAGQPSGLNISSGYSMRRSYNQSNTDSTSLSASASAKVPLDKIPIIGQFFSLGITGSASHQIQSTESKSKDGASGISELMNLDIQHYTFKLKLSDYEKCFVVRINPRHFQDSDQLFTDKILNMFDIAKPLNIHEKMKSTINQIEKLQKLTQGVLICSGEKIQTPIEKFENYYLISQDLKTNSQQEGGDLRNQMFFASLRGAQDYDRFIAILNSKISLPSSYQNLTENQFHSLTKHVQEVIKAAQTHPGFYSATGNSAP